jgi:hypothetical protein
VATGIQKVPAGDSARERFTRSQLSELQVVLQLRGWPIPAPGVYEFVLFVDGQRVTRRRLRVS